MSELHYTTIQIQGSNAGDARRALAEQSDRVHVFTDREDAEPINSDKDPKVLSTTVSCVENWSAEGTVESVRRISRLFPGTAFRLDITAPMGYMAVIPGVGCYAGWDFDGNWCADLVILNGHLTQNPFMETGSLQLPTS